MHPDAILFLRVRFLSLNHPVLSLSRHLLIIPPTPVIKVRYGTLTHWVFIFFALVTNVLVGSQLLLGGSAVVTALTGMNVYAAIFLIPLGVCVYVVLGGLRATFLCMFRENLPWYLMRGTNPCTKVTTLIRSS
jgi:Na+/pantothenate symporter